RRPDRRCFLGGRRRLVWNIASGPGSSCLDFDRAIHSSLRKLTQYSQPHSELLYRSGARSSRSSSWRHRTIWIPAHETAFTITSSPPRTPHTFFVFQRRATDATIEINAPPRAAEKQKLNKGCNWDLPLKIFQNKMSNFQFSPPCITRGVFLNR